jgi:hypothetical protein
MTEQTEIRAVTPAGARLTVTDPPVPEAEGLWVPPDMSGAETEMAIVVERGRDCTLDVDAGDRVYFHAGHFAKINDVKIVPEDCVLAYEKRA